MVNKSLWALAIPAAFVLAGCVDTVDIDKGDSLVLNATKRVVLVKENFEGPWDARLTPSSSRAEPTHLVALRSSNVAGTALEGDPRFEEVGSNARRLVCAEPSPDALSTLAASGAVSVGINGQGGSLGGGLSEAATLAGRTGATQILRDLGYRACEGVMNGVIGAAGYDRIIGGTPPTVLGLVAVEGLTGMRSTDSVTIRSDAPAAEAALPNSLAAEPDPTKGTAGATVGGGKATTEIPKSNATSAPIDGATPISTGTNASADAVVKVVCLASAAASRVPNIALFHLCLGQPIAPASETSVVRNDTSPVGQHATRTGGERASR